MNKTKLIEKLVTRPGLRGNSDLVTDLTAAAGVALANAISTRTRAQKKKKKNPSKENNFPASTITTRTSRPPVTVGTQLRSSVTSPSFKLPFDITAMTIARPTGQTTPSIMGAVGGETTIKSVDLDPLKSLDPGCYPFGFQVYDVAKVFRQYRITKLRAEYIPVVGTSVNASVAFVVTSDPAGSTTIARGWQDVLGSDKSVLTPVWERAAIDCSHINRAWLWTEDPVTSTGSSDRLGSAGVITVASPNSSAIPVDTAMGLIRFVGEIEFQDLSYRAVPLPGASQSASSSSALSPPVGLPSAYPNFTSRAQTVDMNYVHVGPPRQ